jgi:hypothetical protein
MHEREAETQDPSPAPGPPARTALPDDRTASARVLALQRSAGNAAVGAAVRRGQLLARQPAAPPVAAPNPRAVAVETHTAAQADAMTLFDFDTWAQRQVDWASQPAFAGNPLTDQLREVLILAHDLPGDLVLNACGMLPMKDLRAPARDHPEALRGYAKGVAGSWETAPDAKTAVTWGEVYNKLAPVIGDEAVKRSILQNAIAKNVTALIKAKALDDFVKFCDQSRPIMSAQNGSEVDDYLRLRAESNPLSYVGRVGPVRNLHHFTKKALDALVKNRGDRSRAKPLAIVLHSGLDHDGAFHRDANLAAVLTYGKRNTQLIEGAETLADAEGLFTAMVTDYGQGTPPKAQAVMIAGHGDSRLMEMAGGTEQADGTLSKEDVNLDGADPKASEHLIGTIIANVDVGDPKTRIVLNGCLTNSTTPMAPGAADAADPRQVLKDVIDAGNKPTAAQWSAAFGAGRSLSDVIRDTGAPGGLKPEQVSGARSSFGLEAGYMNPVTGDLGLRSAVDPNMTSADKYKYIATAGEADGGARAALEALNEDAAKAEVAMRKRLLVSLARTSWDDKIIKAVFREMLVDKTDLVFAYHATRIAGGISECQFPDMCRPWLVHRAPVAVLARIMGHLENQTEFQSMDPPVMPMAIYQVWGFKDPPSGKSDRFLALLGKMSCQAAKKYVWLDLLRPALATLLPDPPSAGAKGAGELRLALLEVNENGSTADAAALGYLRRRRVGANWANPAAIAAALGGLGSPTAILEAIREDKAAPVGGAPPPAAPPKNFNIDVGGTGTTDMYVTPLSAHGGVVSAAIGHGATAAVHARPDDASPVLGTLPDGAHVVVLGQTEDHQFYVIEFGAGRKPGFVRDVLPM